VPHLAKPVTWVGTLGPSDIGVVVWEPDTRGQCDWMLCRNVDA